MMYYKLHLSSLHLRINVKSYSFLVLILIATSCANMVMPEGGDKDTLPPQFVSSVEIYNDNTKQLKSISLSFDERIQDHQFLSNFYISLLLKTSLTRLKKIFWKYTLKTIFKRT